MLSKQLELAISTLNAEDEGVIAESLVTLKSVIRCYKSLDLPKYIPTIITRLKKFYDTENESIRLSSFTILQLIFEFSEDLKNNLGDKVH